MGCGIRLCLICKQTADIMADKLMLTLQSFTLRSAATGIGRPRVHGDKFKLNDPTTWWTPNHLLSSRPKVGTIVPASMGDLHFQQSALHPMHLIQVEHLDEFGGNPDLYGSPG